MRARRIYVDGVQTRVLTAGQGEPLFLLHGVGLSGDCFVRNIDALANRFSVYAPDLLGHGFTQAVPYFSTAPQLAMALHIVALADQLGLERYSICGSSFGALVAALAYLEQPKRVQRLVLVGSGSVFHPGEEQTKTLRAAANNAGQAFADPTLDTCSRRIAAIVHDPACISPELIWIQATIYADESRAPAYQSTITASIAAMDRPEARVAHRLEALACPTLIIVGRDDVRADWQHHERGAQCIPQSRLSIYERCGHLPFLEHADRFNREVAEFLTP